MPGCHVGAVKAAREVRTVETLKRPRALTLACSGGSPRFRHSSQRRPSALASTRWRSRLWTGASGSGRQAAADRSRSLPHARCTARAALSLATLGSSRALHSGYNMRKLEAQLDACGRVHSRFRKDEPFRRLSCALLARVLNEPGSVDALLLDLRPRELWESCRALQARSYPAPLLRREHNEFDSSIVSYRNRADSIIVLLDDDETLAVARAPARSRAGLTRRRSRPPARCAPLLGEGGRKRVRAHRRNAGVAAGGGRGDVRGPRRPDRRRARSLLPFALSRPSQPRSSRRVSRRRG